MLPLHNDDLLPERNYTISGGWVKNAVEGAKDEKYKITKSFQPGWYLKSSPKVFRLLGRAETSRLFRNHVLRKLANLSEESFLNINGLYLITQ